MYTVNLENNTHFEIGRTYYYHFSCNYDSLSFMQIVSVSDTRKTAVIQELIGGEPYGEPKRKKIYVSGSVEHISAGNYSMAGVWSADTWDKSQLRKDLDLDFMYEHERAEVLEVLPELPVAAPAGTVYTVDVYFCKDYNFYGEKLRAKVEELTTLQNQMKQENAEARRRGEPAPHAAWELSNNRQNLKRYADRLEALERTKAVPTEQTEEIGGKGFRIVRNTDIMRLQFLFDGKPDEQTRKILKSNGFKWAPSQMAWQRQLTANAERAARTVAKAIQ